MHVFYVHVLKVCRKGRYSVRYSIGNAPRFMVSFLEARFSISFNLVGEFSDFGLLMVFLFKSLSIGYARGVVYKVIFGVA